jgi:hypothetical protein
VLHGHLPPPESATRLYGELDRYAGAVRHE